MALVWFESESASPLTVDECRNNLDEPCRMCSSERATYRAGKRWFFNISRISIMCNKYFYIEYWNDHFVDYLINAPRICILKSKYLITKLQNQHKIRLGNYSSWTEIWSQSFLCQGTFSDLSSRGYHKNHMFMLDNCIVE